MSFKEGSPELGVGTLTLGRPNWGTVKKPLISEQGALDFLDHAFNRGVRHICI